MQPTFSIIIPAYNRPRRLAQCLQAINELDYPRENVEVIVVDDGSTRPLSPAIAPFADQIKLTYIYQENAGPAAARNRGAANAQGTYLAFLDDDCAPARSWLSVLATRLEEMPDSMVGGHTVNGLRRNHLSATSQLLVDFLYAHYNEVVSKARFFTSNNFVVPARLFWAIGGFHASMALAAGEDREFCDRWLHHGLEMAYAPDAIIYHYHRLRPSSFWRQHFNYGRGAWLFHQARGQRDSGSMRLEPLTFYLSLISYPLSTTVSLGALQLVAMLCVTQAANGLGFVYQRLLSSRLGHKKRLSPGEPFELPSFSKTV